MNTVEFVGSFPAADFQVQPALPEIAIMGRSNVGKSSLINALIGRKALAHTSKTPGKTRTANVYNIEDRFYLVDLPGYGYARASKSERHGFQSLVQAYLSTRQELAGVVWLLDVRRDPSAEDRAAAELLSERGLPVLAAITKADKLGSGRRAEQARAISAALELEEDQCIVTSARTRDGIQELGDAIDALLAAG
ncbi:MAG: ribosome biogenesis GTP-binding protein YihA/YsxC [Gemmatimonadales bacterium]